MERNKIIAVAVLAIGIIGWRVGAMQQGGQTVTLVTKDGQSTVIAKNRAELFGTLNDLMSDLSEDERNKHNLEIPLKGIAQEADLQALLKDLNWVEEVRRQKGENESEQQAARRMVSAMARLDFNQERLSQQVKAFERAVYLGQMALQELYAYQIADMIMSDASMRLLNQGDKVYSDLIDSLPFALKQYIPENMPSAIRLGQYTIRRNGGVNSVAISADGKKVVMGSTDGRTMIVAWNGNEWVEQYTIVHNGAVLSVAISADGNRVVTGSRDNMAKIMVWNGNEWIEQHTIWHDATVWSVAISADGNKVVTGSWDNTAMIVVWNGNAWVEQDTIVHNDKAWSVAISADGNRVVTGSWDNTVKIVVWNGNEWIEQHTIGFDNKVWSVAISADGNKVVTGSIDNTAKIVVWNGNAWIEQYTIRHNSALRSVAISAEGNRVVTGSMDGTAKIVIWNGNAWIEQYMIRHNSVVESVAISVDGNRVVTGSLNNTAKIVAWNGSAWFEQYKYTIRHNDALNSVAISADGNRVVTGSRDQTAEIVMLVIFSPRSFPGISDFDAWLFVGLLGWAKQERQKISKVGWVGDILRSIRWSEVEPGAKKELQKLIRETM